MRDSTSLACLLACVGGCGSDEVLVEENENEPVALAWLGLLLFVSAESTTKQVFFLLLLCAFFLFRCVENFKFENGPVSAI